MTYTYTNSAEMDWMILSTGEPLFVGPLGLKALGSGGALKSIRPGLLGIDPSHSSITPDLHYYLRLITTYLGTYLR